MSKKSKKQKPLPLGKIVKSVQDRGRVTMDFKEVLDETQKRNKKAAEEEQA